MDRLWKISATAPTVSGSQVHSPVHFLESCPEMGGRAWCGESIFPAQSRGADGRKMARPPRLERGTLCLEGRCSIQLSYGRSPENQVLLSAVFGAVQIVPRNR